MFSLSSLLGKQNLVIYFYPKDYIEGCTKEALTFPDMYKDFTDAFAGVIGISSNSRETHSDFANSHKLPFTLLSDDDQTERKIFSVPRDLFGLLPGRVTYIIDKKGIVRYIFRSQTQVEKHVHESLRILKSLN